jgi:hypothetical protein
VILVTLIAIAVAGCGSGGFSPAAAAPSSRLVITESAGGKTFALKRTTRAVLRLGRKWVWTQPKVHGSAVVLSPVDYESDPGFKEWAITRRSTGTARITASGQPNCNGCTRHARSFSVKLKVR